ncbi:phage head closure protein [Neorhizobium sp. SOG26]
MVVFFDPGQLTARLSLETATATPDGQGGATTTWTEAASLWARIEPVSFQLRQDAGAETGTITHRVWMRFRQDIQAGQRLRKGERVFVVKLVRDPDETERYLVCQCEEKAR